IQLPSPTTGNVSPVDGIGLVMTARPWESAGHGRNTAAPAAASAPRRLRRLKEPRCRIEKLSPRRRQRSITPSYMRPTGRPPSSHGGRQHTQTWTRPGRRISRSVRGSCSCNLKGAFWNEFNPDMQEPERREAAMQDESSNARGSKAERLNAEGLGRRDFLKGAVVGGAAATVTLPQNAGAQQPAPAPAPAAAPDAANPGYGFLNLEEAAFVEALVDHMVPADALTPKGTDIGINIYIDRALASAWGKSDRLYLQGPWKRGAPSQRYQLPRTAAQLYRAGIAATNAHCRKTYGKPFDRLDETQREEVLVGLSTGKVSFDDGLPARSFWTTVYQTVMEGMFSDPIYGGNRNKAGWRLIGFPGAIAVHRENIVKYRDKKFPADPVSISDMS